MTAPNNVLSIPSVKSEHPNLRVLAARKLFLLCAELSAARAAHADELQASDALQERIDTLTSALSATQAENVRLRSALEKYADESNWTMGNENFSQKDLWKYVEAGYEIAQAALQGIGPCNPNIKSVAERLGRLTHPESE